MTEATSAGGGEPGAEAAEPLEFFEGFSWAVPKAFAGALAAFRFEQGDVLHPSGVAYEALSDASPAAGAAIQVLQPPRSARALPADGESDRRAASWRSDVELEWVDLEAGTSRALTTSQGRLLMLLWTGDRSWLDPERESPPVPESARALAQHLDDARVAFDGLGGWAAGVRFLFVVDLASDASRSKARDVEEALSGLGAIRRVDLSPEAAGVERAASFHPALVLRAIGVTGSSAELATAALRGVLYGGGQAEAPVAAENEGEAERPDRFSVGRHGLLEAIGAD